MIPNLPTQSPNPAQEESTALAQSLHRSNLLQGVAEATSYLLTQTNFAEAMQTALATLGQITQVDRVYLFEIHPHPTTGESAASQRFDWTRPGIQSHRNNPALQNCICATSGLSRWFEVLNSGQPICGLVQQLPPDEQAALVVRDTRSLLMVPIHIHGQLWGLIGFDDCQRDRQWASEEEAVLQMMAVSIGGAIARQQIEAALRLSEEKFSKAFRSSPNPMSIATLDTGRLIEVNDSFLQAVGYEREAVIGNTVNDLRLWANLGDREAVMQLLRQQGSVHNRECQFCTKSGAIFTALFSAEVIQIRGELCLIDVAVDITDRLQAEQQLRDAAERDRLLGEIALRIHQSLDLEQILETTVAEVRQFLKADRVYIRRDVHGARQILAEAVDPAWRSILQPIPINAALLAELRRIFSDKQTYIVNDTREIDGFPAVAAYYEQFNIRASLGVPLMINNQLFGLLVVNQCAAARTWQSFEVNFLERLATQVSIAIQQAQLYRQVQDLNAGLEQLVNERTAQLQQKMEELQELNRLKDEFLNAFSHDLKTPVMGILLVIKNLLNQAGDSIPVARSILERIVQSSDHQLDLLNSLLQAYSNEDGVSLDYELVQMSELTQTIIEDLEPLIAKNQAKFKNCLPPNLPLVNADSIQLRRVFENLITNALYHNPAGINLILNVAIEAEMLRFTLQDNGVGIPPEMRDRLFHRYRRGRNVRYSAGVGLGLYLCRQIITAHGGEIGVSSTLGAGSTFWFTLPLAISSEANQ